MIHETDASPSGLTMAELTAAWEIAGLTPADFEHGELDLAAHAYRTIIWRLAQVVAERQGMSPDLTGAEYRSINLEGRTSFDLILQLDEEASDSYEVFRMFIEEHADLIPVELRQRFDVWVGFNYGARGGFVIGESSIYPITQAELEDESTFTTDDLLGDPTDYEKYFIFTGLVRERIDQLL